jgi:hypothetical protein
MTLSLYIRYIPGYMLEKRMCPRPKEEIIPYLVCPSSLRTTEFGRRQEPCGMALRFIQ